MWGRGSGENSWMLIKCGGRWLWTTKVLKYQVTNPSPLEGDEAIKCHHICRKNELAAPWVKTIFKLRDRKSSCTVQVSAGACRCVVCSGGEPWRAHNPAEHPHIHHCVCAVKCPPLVRNKTWMFDHQGNITETVMRLRQKSETFF